ncbi:unnamed protein product [Cochlearia groenlandica]
MKVFFFIIFLFKSCVGANDTLTRRQFLKDGDVIVSSNKRFAFGFFSPGDSKLRYVGIWYNEISEQTVVWVANRDRPINNTSGLIKFSNRDGNNLCVYASDNETEPLWSTNVSYTISAPTLVARLSEFGNLVLLDSITRTSLWESFDHPTDTFLPFMRFGFTRKDGLDRFLTSWRSRDDPGQGNFTLKLEHEGFPQAMMYNGLSPLWRGGTWTGQRWSGIPEKTLKSAFTISFVNNQDEVTNTYGLLNTSFITRLVLSEAGILQRFKWDEDYKHWIGLRPNPKEQCDNYAHCGPNGFCDPPSTDTLECLCLPGYKPESPDKWSMRDPSNGCTRKNTSILCNERKRFVKLKLVKIPNTSVASVDMNITLKECEQTCLRNCDCVAYASAYYENEGRPKGCLTWYGDMLDTRTYSSSGQDLYVRVDKAEFAAWNRNGSSKKRILVMVIIAVMLLIVILFCFIMKRQTESNKQRRSATTFAPSYVDFGESLRFEELQDKARNRELPLFELTTIATATQNFSLHNKLGEGGFGSVYKGMLENGMEIAVKRLSTNSGQGMVEFKNEVKLISKLQHRNLVRILGCCVELDEKMLIYEYLPNKSLDYFIFDEERRVVLDWPKRIDIIRGIARGILYLHHDSRLRIIHRDLKASNILLDNEMIPKIADFGMARIFGGNQIEGNTKRVVGTYGYMSPEYAMDGHFSIKSDVYSFGVLILEIITGKKNSGCYNEFSNLLGLVWDLWNKGEAKEIIDTLIDKEACDESEVMKCTHIGLLCVQENASDRPDMSTVVLMLGHNSVDLPSPKHPAFTTGRRGESNDGGSSSGAWISGENGTSVNDVTLTAVLGR